VVGPEAIDQLVGGDRAVGAQREHREHPSRLASSEWYRPAVDEHIDAAEDADLYGQLSLFPERRYTTCGRAINRFDRCRSRRPDRRCSPVYSRES
jgi:hypothetical protein